MSSCIGGCAGNTAPLGTIEENIVNVMAPVVNAGIPLMYFTQKRGLGAATFMFERKEITNPDGSVAWSYVMKAGVGGDNKFQRVSTNSDCQLEWREQFKAIASTTVAATATASNTLTVTDINGLRGIGAGSKIEVYTGGVLRALTVASILGNVITFNVGVTITAAIGDCVYRGTYSRGKGCTDLVANAYGLQGYQKKISNFRNISLSLEFRTCDLSVDRFVNYLGENGAQRFIEEYKQAAVEGFVDEIRSAFYLDRNLKDGVDVDGNTVDVAGVNETMGLLSEITRAQVALDKDLIVDISGCCAGATCGASDIKVIQSFFEVIRQAHKSGLYEDNVVTIVANHLFLENMQKMQSAFRDAVGAEVMYMVEANGGYNITQAFPTIQLGDIKVERLYDDRLDKYNEPLAIVLPKKYIYFAQRQYRALSSNMTVTNDINASISTGFPWLRFQDDTLYRTNRYGDCFFYSSDFEYAVVIAGIESGAYRVIKGFAPCEDICGACNDTTNLRSTVV